MVLSEILDEQMDLVNDFQLVIVKTGHDCDDDCPGHCNICFDFSDYCQGHSPTEWLDAAVYWAKKQANPLSLLHIDWGCKVVEFYQAHMDNSLPLGHATWNRPPYHMEYMWYVRFDLHFVVHAGRFHTLEEVEQFVENIGIKYGREH